MEPTATKDEGRRLVALRESAVLDSPPEPEFDEITQLAAQLCRAPMATVTFVDEFRQWFKSRQGIDLTETPRQHSFCTHALGSTDLFIISDALDDPRFATNPLVVGPPHIRFYAGAPLRTRAGESLGTLCVFDQVARTLSDEQQLALRVLSRHVMTLLDQRRLTQSLDVERSRLSEAQAVAGMGSWETDLASLAAHWSEETHRIFGTDPTVTAPTHQMFLSFVHPADRVAVNEAFERSFESSDPCRIEHRIIRADGKERVVEERWRVHRDAQGRPLRAIGSIQDRTDRLKMDQDFLRAQRLESIGTLAGGIAHDLNNVFAPILLSAAMLRSDIKDDASQELLAMIESSANRGADMVRQVLTFARGAEGRRLPVELNQLLREIQKFVRETFPKQITCRTSLLERKRRVLGDPTQLHQVLINLCVNARDAMPDGGTLHLSMTELEIDEQYAASNPDAQSGRHLVIEVADEGIGMTREVMDRMFDPFYTTKEFGRGTGLGLSTSLAIIRSHGGFVRVESTPGSGTRFRVHLPIDAEAASAPIPGDAELPVRGSGELILIVDDELSIREITSRSLRALGYRTLIASDGEEAVSLFALHSDEVALVLTDMMMPILDGEGLIRVLTRIRPGIRIIATSGLSSTADLSDAHRGAIHAFLSKPYSAATLAKTVSEALHAPPSTADAPSDQNRTD